MIKRKIGSTQKKNFERNQVLFIKEKQKTKLGFKYIFFLAWK